MNMDSHNNIFLLTSRLLGGGGGDEAADDHAKFGVHVEYSDLYAVFLFFVIIYVFGQMFSRLLYMPALVGEIVAGVIFGPSLLDFVPFASSLVLIGEIGLILLVVEAGIDMDLVTLKLIGTRGIIIAVLGSIMPIVLGLVIALALGIDTKGAIAAGASFGPTSAGIAVNILRSAKIINTPIGQLIIAAAIIDDMIALVILSQLGALAGEITLEGVLVPIFSALGFLVLGGYIAINVIPFPLEKFMHKYIPEENQCQFSMAVMFGLLTAMIPATYYAKASYLMGAFISGLAFCRDADFHHFFVGQFKRVLTWLLRIFFACSIGFQVPLKQFGDGEVIWKGVIFSLALIGKLGTGLLVPNLSPNQPYFKGNHLRDCLIVGFSMMAEGEFAFVLAFFAVDQGLISQKLYASIVLAILFSTIFAPFALRIIINRDMGRVKKELDEIEGEGRDLAVTDLEEDSGRSLFICIETQSAAKWGLFGSLIQSLYKLGLEIVDHRSWHPEKDNSHIANEIYAKDTRIRVYDGKNDDEVEERVEEIKKRIKEVVNQETAKVNVGRWIPGVVEEDQHAVMGAQNGGGEIKSGGERRRRVKQVSNFNFVFGEAQKRLSVHDLGAAIKEAEQEGGTDDFWGASPGTRPPPPTRPPAADSATSPFDHRRIRPRPRRTHSSRAKTLSSLTFGLAEVTLDVGGYERYKVMVEEDVLRNIRKIAREEGPDRTTDVVLTEVDTSKMKDELGGFIRE